jgi:hypothetical protein
LTTIADLADSDFVDDGPDPFFKGRELDPVVASVVEFPVVAVLFDRTMGRLFRRACGCMQLFKAQVSPVTIGVYSTSWRT